MSEGAGIKTWDAMRELGFTLDDSCPYGERPPLAYDFGPVRLLATWVTGRFFKEIVFVTGILKTARTMADIEFEMPRTLDSIEQCAAWFADKLDRAAGGDVFISPNPIEWLHTGRLHINELPWMVEQAAYEAERAAYAARIHCRVDREWMRVIRGKLREGLEECAHEDLISFSFFAGALTIRLPTDKLVCQAEGEDWPHSYAVSAAQLKNLPKRFMGTSVVIGEWQGTLELGDSRYEGVSILNGINDEQP